MPVSIIQNIKCDFWLLFIFPKTTPVYQFKPGSQRPQKEELSEISEAEYFTGQMPFLMPNSQSTDGKGLD